MLWTSDLQRFHLARRRVRVTYWLASGRRIVLLTVFGKTRGVEAVEVDRAHQAQKVCEAERDPAHVTYERFSRRVRG
ncbi:hypothetical protein [Allostreptomyces psammosilenae]|uniref:Uncharacterized protein n=1 Tax=Allostreptomyces psammosilenae TaxID=1892865 RepID=A0A852ZX92_9ACTN|nr:hypothetical protein [Allostreptomyces psammosilenae]NYI07013.1 hypothetical protein [Allostreptomyces psammosilenae]